MKGWSGQQRKDKVIHLYSEEEGNSGVQDGSSVISGTSFCNSWVGSQNMEAMSWDGTFRKTDDEEEKGQKRSLRIKLLWSHTELYTQTHGSAEQTGTLQQTG